LKDRRTNYTGIWDGCQMAEINARFIVPIETEAKKVLERRNIERYTTEEQARDDYQQTLSKLHEVGLPDITFEDFMKRNVQVSTNMTLLLSIVSHVQSLICQGVDPTD